MSEDDYKTMLYFDSHRPGSFMRVDAGDGIELRIALPRLPPIEGLPKHITEMHVHVPIRDFRLRESAQRMRDMEAPEVAAVRKMFDRAAHLVRQLFGLELDGFEP